MRVGRRADGACRAMRSDIICSVDLRSTACTGTPWRAPEVSTFLNTSATLCRRVSCRASAPCLSTPYSYFAWAQRRRRAAARKVPPARGARVVTQTPLGERAEVLRGVPGNVEAAGLGGWAFGAAPVWWSTWTAAKLRGGRAGPRRRQSNRRKAERATGIFFINI